MYGRIYSTPWGRNAIAAYWPGGMADLIRRVPARHVLSVTARRASGPWRVELVRDGKALFGADTRAEAFQATVEQAVAMVWP